MRTFTQENTSGYTDEQLATASEIYERKCFERMEYNAINFIQPYREFNEGETYNEDFTDYGSVEEFEREYPDFSDLFAEQALSEVE